MILDRNTVIDFLNKNKKLPDWVREARRNNDELKALINGDNFSQFLLNKIEKIESDVRSIARKKYSKDIRDLFDRLLKKRENVFQANGGSELIKFKSEKIEKEFISILSNIQGGKSLQEYLAEYYFQQADIDPNGLIFLEYKTEPNIEVYPTYKCIKDIRFYECEGQKLEVVIFEPKLIVNQDNKFSTETWRIVDEKTDWTITYAGGIYIINEQKTFEHPFGEVPALILSNKERIGYKTRLSNINTIIELAKDYARDKSILTIYKFQNGFPIHWRYVTQCRDCTGTGKTGDGKSCKTCDSKGYLGKSDVTDVINVTKPREGDPILTPELAGFIQPDLKTWKQYQDDLVLMEQSMEKTLWGTVEIKGKNETATGRFIDVQPISNELNRYTNNVEWIHNQLGNWIANLIDPSKNKDEKVYYRSYGRRFIIETPDVILERYEKSKLANDNSTILDKLLEEFVLSKYKTDPYMQSQMLKKIQIEPYVHWSLDQIIDTFGIDEAKSKILFQEFWKTADTQLSVEELSKQFNTYKNGRSNTGS